VFGHRSLVGVGVSDVEGVGLGGGCSDVGTKLLPRGRRSLGYGVMVVAHAYHFCDTVGESLEAVHQLGLELDRPRLALDVGTLEIWDVPVGTTVDPHRKPERGHLIGYRHHKLAGENALFEDGHGAIDDEPPVERCDGGLEVKWLNQHLHT